MSGWTLRTAAPLLLGPRAGVACFPICSSGPQLPPRASGVKLQIPPLPTAPSAGSPFSSTRLNSLAAAQPREVKSRAQCTGLPARPPGPTEHVWSLGPRPEPRGCSACDCTWARTLTSPVLRPGASGSDLSPWAPDRAPSALPAFPQHRPLKLPPAPGGGCPGSYPLKASVPHPGQCGESGPADGDLWTHPR